MDQTMLTVKWEAYIPSYTEVLSSIRQTQAFSDATIACDGKFYNVHKLVMSTCSDYLRTLFEKVNICSSPVAHPVIILQGVAYQHMESLLDYMYLGQMNVLQSELESLIKAAETLQIKGLGVPDNPVVSDCNENERYMEDTNMPDFKRCRHDIFAAKVIEKFSNSFDVQESSKYEIKSNIENQCEVKMAQLESTPIVDKMSLDHSECLSIKQELTANQIKECNDTKDTVTKIIRHLDNPQISVSEHENSSNSKYEETSCVTEEPNCSNIDSTQYSENMNDLTPSKLDTSKSSISPGGPIEAIDLWLQLKTNKGLAEGVVCPLCPKHCKNKGVFLNHYKTHTGDKPFACPHCSKCFVQRASLRNHLKTHTGERPFACPFCHRRFIQKKNLKNHITVHVGK